jgi:hypothetical protein
MVTALLTRMSLQAYHGDGGLWRPRMVLTIHNLENTGGSVSEGVRQEQVAVE